MKHAQAITTIALVLLVVGCTTSRRVGMNVASVSAALATEEISVADGIARAATERLGGIDLRPVIRDALSRAIRRARTLPPDFAEVQRSLESLPESRVDLTWSPDPFPIEGNHVLGSSISCSASAGPHELVDGTVLRGEAAVQVVPWPREPGFTPHPEIVLCHASVQWYSEIAGGFLFAEAFVQELAQAVAGIVAAAAEDARVGVRLSRQR